MNLLAGFENWVLQRDLRRAMPLDSRRGYGIEFQLGDEELIFSESNGELIR